MINTCLFSLVGGPYAARILQKAIWQWASTMKCKTLPRDWQCKHWNRDHHWRAKSPLTPKATAKLIPQDHSLTKVSCWDSQAYGAWLLLSSELMVSYKCANHALYKIIDLCSLELPFKELVLECVNFSLCVALIPGSSILKPKWGLMGWCSGYRNIKTSVILDLEYTSGSHMYN